MERTISSADTDHAVEIGQQVWWVGHYLPDDVFQCHVYLIENGRNSILIDPGSALTFAHTLKKIEEVVPFSHIRYFICHHQDPDITGALGVIDQMISRDDALLVTHWRAEALLKHYALQHLSFWRVEDNNWKLELGDRTLHFIFTPYMHFPGAFCTFEDKDHILFSSDIFGGFTEKWELFARDESYFEALKPFHEHYMPSRDILQHGLSRMQRHPIRMIAPQHGSIIPEDLVEFMFERLKGLECGLYLMVEGDADIRHLVAMNRMLHQTMEAMVLYREFRDIARHLLEATQQLLPATSIDFYIQTRDNSILHLGPVNRYHGRILASSRELDEYFSQSSEQWMQTEGRQCRQIRPLDGQDAAKLMIPLFSPHSHTCKAIVEIHLGQEVDISRELDNLLGQLKEPLLTAVEREMIYRTVEEERNTIYEQSIRDPLTGLFTRHYMKDAVSRMLELHNRDGKSPVTLVMVDIDHFKQINDTYGHIKGDEVLREVGSVIQQESRSVDVPVRFGGEEFAIFLSSTSVDQGLAFAERIRRKASSLSFEKNNEKFRITLSAGVAQHQKGDGLEQLIEQADAALYRAKEEGRNRVFRWERNDCH